MSTKIPYVTDTNNPIAGCEHVSPGCDHCYAEIMAGRINQLNPVCSKYKLVIRQDQTIISQKGNTTKVKLSSKWNGGVSMELKDFKIPFHWKKPRRVFLCSMGDLFYKEVPNEWIDRLMTVIAMNPQHIFMVLTKRPARMKEYIESRSELWDYIKDLAWDYAELLDQKNMPKDWMFDTDYQPDGEGGYTKDPVLIWEGKWPLQNLWLGVTAENQTMADARIPILLKTPAVKRFVSYEPALGPVDFCKIRKLTGVGYVATNSLAGVSWYEDIDTNQHDWYSNKLDWIICGAESGPGHRPMDEDWVMRVKQDCVRFSVPFFFKQKYIGNKKIHMPLLHGRTWSQIPQ